MSRRAVVHARARASALAALTATALTAVGTPSLAADGAEGPLNRAFARAAGEFGVPRDLLAAVGYGESRLDGHAGRPSQANGYGVMHLASNPVDRTLERAVALTGASPSGLLTDTATNVRGGAAVLRDYADRLGLDAHDRADLDAWYPVVARYGGGTDGPASVLYADTVYALLAEGIDVVVPEGERISTAGRPVAPHRETPATDEVRAPSPDYPSALWVPAHPDNYAVGRSAKISKVVLHVTQGSYAGSVNWFRNPAAGVSAHYLVRSSDGEITQMVRDRDTAYHVRDSNASTLGIEHEGFVDDPSWFTEVMYRSSAALTRYLCDRYGIPKDRAHIVGHEEVPGNNHTDPGRHWDWARYMELVGAGAGGAPGLPASAVQAVAS